MQDAVKPLKVLNANVIVAALGYFVDIYDLLLFGIVRVPSLKSLGLQGDQLFSAGVLVLNVQMIGMLVGGLIWGIIGDKKGRLSVLFGSIALYSLANIANAYVTNVEMYAVLRFLAGVGLAGELGAAVTLVSETLSKENRGMGTTVVATVGIFGGVFGGFVAAHTSWSNAYLIGGGMGIALLLLRVSMFESGMFQELKKSTVIRGSLKMLFLNREKFLKYVRCILIGVPVWYVVGVLVTFSPELAKDFGIVEPINAGSAIMWCYAGTSLGDFGSGYLSQIARKRKLIVGIFLALCSLMCLLYIYSSKIFGSGMSAGFFYTLIALMGFTIGYWAVFATIAAEQFGTNMRATVATSVPNFVRGMTAPLTMGFRLLQGPLGLTTSAMVVGVITLSMAFLALYFMQETFGKDLNYMETA